MPSQELTENRTNPRNEVVDHFWGTETGPWQLCLASNPSIMQTGNLNGLIKPWCPTWECLWNDVFLVLHSARAGCPLDTLKIYWNDPKEPSRTCLTANTLETDLLWTYLMINLIYIYISSLILYKNLLFPAMYSRLEQAHPDRIVAHFCVIWVQCDPLSLIWTCQACVLISIALWKPVCFVDCCYWIQEVLSDLRRSKPDSLHLLSNHIPLIFNVHSQVDHRTPKQTFQTMLN